MADPLYSLTYANVPFFPDRARVVRMPPVHTDQKGTTEPDVPRKFQVEPDMLDEVNRLIPMMYLDDFASPRNYPGRSTNQLAIAWPESPWPDPKIRVGDWYYPTGASRWSVFRGLATSTMAKDMLAATNGNTPATFSMLASLHDVVESDYTVETQMYLLPPRPLAEHGGGLDGLYLITLVDERYFNQYNSVSLRPKHDTTWTSLITSIATALTVTVTYSDIDAAYGQPEPDSQLWSSAANAAVLLDAVALSLGRVVVRNMNGTYVLLTHAESSARVRTNRPHPAVVARLAGGDMFTSGGKLLVGNLGKARNAVAPSSVAVAFPKYVVGNDPVPHFLNPRTAPQQQSVWVEDSYGVVHTVSVPIASGQVSGNLSGLTGTGSHTVRVAGKALYSGEADTSGLPLNASGLNALAMKVAQDYYQSQVAFALDEVYPGTFNWTPEGIHDIVWTYSERSRLASTRVMRSPWNQAVQEMQHATPPVSGFTNTPIGVGGPSVAQTVRDSISAGYSGLLASGLASGGTFLFLSGGGYPTTRWRAKVNDEILLAEGPSVVFRGIDGTVQKQHLSGPVTELTPHTAYGVNLLTFGNGMTVRQQAWTSGGVSEALVNYNTGVCTSGDNSFLDYSQLCGSGGSQEQWQRTITTVMSGGCLTHIRGVWSFERDLCVPCTCSGQSPPADLHWCVQSGSSFSCIALGTTPPTAVGGPYPSPGQCTASCDTRYWCVSNGGSPTCVASLTVPAGMISGPYASAEECDSACVIDPPPTDCTTVQPCGACSSTSTPPSWSFSSSSFQGDCSIFNGFWELFQVSACSWLSRRADGTVARITISGGTITLTLFSVIEGDIAVSARYSASLSSCCQAAVLVLGSSNGCDVAPPTLTATPFCCDDDPLYWCTSGGCVQAASAPAGTISGPYTTQAECTAACDGIETECCSGTYVPSTLYAHFGGSLASVGTQTLTYNETFDWWEATPAGNPCAIGQIRFFCTGGPGFVWDMQSSITPGGCSGTLVSCGPLEWTCTGSIIGPCSGGGDYTVTVDENP